MQLLHSSLDVYRARKYRLKYCFAVFEAKGPNEPGGIPLSRREPQQQIRVAVSRAAN